MMQRGGMFFSLAAGALLFAVDRGHKFYQIAIGGWTGGETVHVTRFFDYMLVWNTGISYGLFGQLPLAAIIGLMAVGMAVLAWWWWRASAVLTRLGLALALGGAVSHVIDRLIYGAVPDFFYFHWGDLGFYVFNIADAGITIGVVLLFVDAFTTGTQPADRPNDA